MKIQSPWMGRIKGSAGNMTGCKVYDKNVMRAKAFEVSNPNTAAQQNQRTFFAELTALCSDFDEALLRTLFPQKPKSMSRRNAITKQIAENTTTDNGQKVINYATIDTLGNASVMDFGNTTFSTDNNTPTVTLDASVSQIQEYADNHFIAALINETKGEIYIGTNSAKVSVGTFTAAIPGTWALTDTIHAIPFITDSKAAVTGFGTMSVIKRPARANG